MVLCLKTWESRSSPGLPRTETSSLSMRRRKSRRCIAFDAGWSSPVARQAHNLKAAGSNPAPATNDPCITPAPEKGGVFAVLRPETLDLLHDAERGNSMPPVRTAFRHWPESCTGNSVVWSGVRARHGLFDAD